MAVKTATKKPQDASTRQIYDLLRRAFPDISEKIEDVIYRFSPVSIRILVVSEKFNGLDRKQRLKLFDRTISTLDRNIQNDITLLLLLTPDELNLEETRLDWLFIEFHNPRLSRL